MFDLTKGEETMKTDTKLQPMENDDEKDKLIGNVIDRFNLSSVQEELKELDENLYNALLRLSAYLPPEK